MEQEHDCAVCLQKCHHPTQLPCGHIFCFLCVKGVAIQSKKCAMCRAEIPPNYLDHPIILEKTCQQQSGEITSEEHQWYYEGRNGWWKYDERSNSELETAFSAGETECILLLAGALYCINFQSMVQVRRSDTTRRRHVKRDTPLLPAKGIAGIKTAENVEQTKDESTNNALGDANDVIEILDVNDHTEQNADANAFVNDVNETINRLSSINIQEGPDDIVPVEET